VAPIGIDVAQALFFSAFAATFLDDYRTDLGIDIDRE